MFFVYIYSFDGFTGIKRLVCFVVGFFYAMELFYLFRVVVGLIFWVGSTLVVIVVISGGVCGS